MRLRSVLPMIVCLGLLGGCSQSGKSGGDSAKKYTNPDENKKGGGGGAQTGASGDALSGGKADNNSGGPAANMSNSSNSDDAETTKHQPGMANQDGKTQKPPSSSNNAK